MRKSHLGLVALAFAFPLASAFAQPHLGGGHTQASASASAHHPPRYVPATGPLAAEKDALAQGNYADAEKVLKGISGKSRGDALAELVRLQTLQGKDSEAEATCKQLAAAGRAADAAALRAYILFHTGKRDEAIKLLESQKNATGDGGREVRVELGEFLIDMGRRADADPYLQTLVSDYNSDAVTDKDAVGMTLVGRATELLRAWKNADESYQSAEKDDDRNIRARMWHAMLDLDKFNMAGAEKHAREVLKLEPKNPDAIVLMARIKLAQTMDFDTAEGLVKDALAVNPNHPGAHDVRAGLALHDMDIKTSEAEIAAALASDPNDLAAWSLKAAARFLADDRAGYDAARKETLARDKEYSKFYTTVSEYAEWEHRYDDIIAMMKDAVKVDPDDGLAWAQLGLLETRRGDEQQGVKDLNTAWSDDHYNAYVLNTLKLYESNFANDYDLVDEGPFKIRYLKKTEPILRRYVPRMLGEAWASMKARYGFVPAQPVQIEIFEPDEKGKISDARQQFNVRISGLPGGMLQGVCFGHVIAAMGPAAEPFNWGNVLWHELGHVFAIQLSKNHVPRWFTEGLSEYETIARRPEWQREMDPELYVALSHNRLPGAVDMNHIFTHAESAEDITVAYYAASQMMVFTVETFGMPKVVKALELWGQNEVTADVIPHAFGVSAADYDRMYREWQMKRLDRYKGQFIPDLRMVKTLQQAKDAVAKSPNDGDALVDLTIAYVREEDEDNAKATLDKALKADPKNFRAHYLAFRFAGHDTDAAQTELATIQSLGGDGYFVRAQLALIAKRKKDKAEYKKQLEAAYRFDPTQVEPLGNLFELAKEENREADEVDILRKAAMLDQHDPKLWGALLKHLVDDKEWQEAKKIGEAALFVAIYDAHVHMNYARALSALGDHERAVFELESALLCEPNAEDAATAHALEAEELVTLKRGAEAKSQLDEAKRLDPNNAEIKNVKLP
ncbi:MAG TPA: tetratricopeptide repeat protein [Polyangiaceae bacterium]